jgi:4-amino-4-deoxy-L-arabinose transferase-like glycosyltransferase
MLVSNAKPINRLLGVVTLFLLINAFFLLPDEDAYYYWNWGQHLALGYLDGPPLVAYVLRGFTVFWGNSLFTLNSYAAITTLCSAFLVYKIAVTLSDDQHIGRVAALLWLICLGIQRNLVFCGVTYDNLEILFWNASVYFVLQYLKHKTNRVLYAASIALGLLLETKYTGVILALGLFTFFISNTSLRALFKNKHLYFAALLTLFIFSPNLLWNAQHAWRGFYFQLHAHPRDTEPVVSIMRYLREAMNYYLFPCAFIAFFRYKHQGFPDKFSGWALLWHVSLVLVLFWLILSYSANVRVSYLTAINTVLMSSLAYYVVRFQYEKTLWFIITTSLITIIALTIKFELTPNSRLYNFNLLNQANYWYLKGAKQPVISGNNYQMLSELRFTNPKIQITASPACDTHANQFRYWNRGLRHALRTHQIPRALYVDYADTPQCITPYFKQCTALPPLEYRTRDHSKVLKRLYRYQCIN